MYTSIVMVPEGELAIDVEAVGDHELVAVAEPKELGDRVSIKLRDTENNDEIETVCDEVSSAEMVDDALGVRRRITVWDAVIIVELDSVGDTESLADMDGKEIGVGGIKLRESDSNVKDELVLDTVSLAVVEMLGVSSTDIEAESSVVTLCDREVDALAVFVLVLSIVDSQTM